MPEPQSRLQVALAARYGIERELGQGGMATVYLAEDLKHHRKVAVKVLRPELAATLGPERFAREIEVAARLQHPHILGLLDSGDADGFFYYVMPYVEGETLRDRLARGGELPVPEAVRLLGEIAEALAAAHRAGVVHRDIKPENVMLVGTARDGDGLRRGQGGDRGVERRAAHLGRRGPRHAGVHGAGAGDGRPADGWTGGHLRHRRGGLRDAQRRPAFPGLNAQQTLAAHVTRTPVPVGQQRDGLSPALEAVVMRCLAKRPADRFQTADELMAALEPLALPSGGITPTQTQPVAALAAKRPGEFRRTYAIAGAAALIAAALFLWKPWARAGARPLDANLVAVLPFRTAGADPSVQYLRQGMVDLMQAKLTGEGGPRAADTRSVLAAVRDAGGGDAQDLSEDAAATVARKVGAGRVLQGSIVGSPEHLVMNASLVAVPGGQDPDADQRGGSQGQSLRPDRPAHGRAAGARRRRQLSPAQRAHDHQPRRPSRLPRRRRRLPPGRLPERHPLLARAVELDSTFALALSALVEADGWHPATTDMKRIRGLAWQ